VTWNVGGAEIPPTYDLNKTIFNFEESPDLIVFAL
jgi:hypothetical protein